MSDPLSKADLEQVHAEAQVAAAEPTKFFGMSFEQGIEAGLGIALGYTTLDAQLEG